MQSDVISFDSLQDHFHQLVIDARDNQHVDVSDETTHYLTGLLVSFSSVDTLFHKDEEGRRLKPLAIMFCEAHQEVNPALRYQGLRHLGDTALFIAGMFPGVLRRKPVGLDYYIAMGGSAYGAASDLVGRLNFSQAFSGIFLELGGRFALLVDVLSEVAENSNLNSHADILELYEQWMQTGSKRIANKLRAAGIEPVDFNNKRRQH
ncbi:MAG: hypothetical protein OQL16_01605 [Gammaproteobacteria bacterium]|nr:hypothetical protein [Gammaproteobacteria bacterium]